MNNTTDEPSQDKPIQGQVQDEEHDEMLPEYDLSAAFRSKYPEAMRHGYTTTVHHPDGTATQTFHLPLPEGAIMLDPDLWAYFPDSATVNQVLHLLVKQYRLLEERKPSLPEPQREERTG